MNKITLKDRVLMHLYAKGNITSLQAFRDYGATRLSAIIYDLRAEGNNIETTYITRKNRYGDRVTFAKYILHQKGE